MPAWFRTRVVDGRRMFVELLQDGRVLLEPERHRLEPDEVRWLDEEVMPELRRERAVYEVGVRQHLRDVRKDRPSTV
jgi:hypothetical protein